MSEVVAVQAGSSAKRRRKEENGSESPHDTDGAESAMSSASAPRGASPRRRLRKIGSNEAPVNDTESLLSLLKPSEAVQDTAEEADSDNSSKSSDNEVDKEIDRGEEAVAAPDNGQPMEEDQAEKKPEGAEPDSDSSSSSSSSSSASSTSSSSSSSSSTDEEEEEVEIIVQEEEEDDGREEDAIELVETPEKKREKDYQACRASQLRRKDLIWLLHQLPRQEAEKAIKRAWVRITVQGGNVLAQVTDLEDLEEPYAVVSGSSDRPSSVKVALRCRRCMPPERTYKLTNISNQEVTIEEFEQWIKLTEKHGLDYAVFRPNWKEKAREFSEAKNYTFDDKTVAEMLRRKTSLGIDIEFDAQKESRLRAELQGSRTQMELCGLRDARASEVEQRYQNGILQIEELYRKSANLQTTWFEKRPNMYSIKEINTKNKNRQVARDKHALNYTYSLEEADVIALAEGRTVLDNPFARRPCRPQKAWDTKLTETEGLEQMRPSVYAKAAEAPEKEPAKAAATEETTNGDKEHAPTRVDRRAHRDLLSMMSALMAGGTSSSGLTAVSAS